MNSPRAIQTRRLRAFALLVACFLSAAARAQSMPTASRPGDIQFGGGFALGNSTYNFNKLSLTGGSAYATFDKRYHWGFEAGFHQVKPSSDPTIYERTYELGPRFYLTRGRLAPYGKVLIGRGVYNFSGNIANIAYNLYTVGGGADFALTPNHQPPRRLRIPELAQLPHRTPPPQPLHHWRRLPLPQITAAAAAIVG